MNQVKNQVPHIPRGKITAVFRHTFLHRENDMPQQFLRNPRTEMLRSQQMDFRFAETCRGGKGIAEFGNEPVCDDQVGSGDFRFKQPAVRGVGNHKKTNRLRQFHIAECAFRHGGIRLPRKV